MDFFEHQERARRKSLILILYFAVAVVLIIVAVYFAVSVAFFGMGSYMEDLDAAKRIINSELFLGVAGATLFLILCGTLYKVAALSGGGETVALSQGGRLVPPASSNHHERKVLNVVEEMAIASGMPVPTVYVLEEQGINAFAAGYTVDDAVIGVSRGCIELLSRDELQGVMAHEFSHILNGDMRTNIRLIGVLHGIILIGLLGRGILRSIGQSTRHVRRRSNNKGGGGGIFAILFLGAFLVAIGYIGVLFGRLIKSALSRQREYLADASAVQFTRNPDGIAGALKKIGGLVHGSTIAHPGAEEVSHMYFGNALKPSFFNGFATHPPLEKRIRRIDPSFEGTYPIVTGEPVRSKSRKQPKRPHVPLPFPFPMGGKSFPVLPEMVVAGIGAPRTEHLPYSNGLQESFPSLLGEMARDAYGARAVIYGLLLDSDEQIRKRQLAILSEKADNIVLRDLKKLLPELEELPTEIRLPLLDLTLPSLEGISPEQCITLSKNAQRMMEADKEIDLFEFMLQCIFQNHFRTRFGSLRKGRTQSYSLKPLHTECQLVLSLLAHLGEEQKEGAELAFRLGAIKLNLPDEPLTLLPKESCGLAALKDSLDKLKAVSPKQKRLLVEACATAAIADREITVKEGELLRAVCAVLDCPLPPLLIA